MISIFLQGGLGNQLFQIFAYISFCIQTGDKIVIPKNKLDKFSAEGFPRNTYWDTIFKRLSIFLSSDDKKLFSLPYYNEPFYNYYPLIKYPNNLEYMFKGYFQSYKYFENNFKKIKKMIGIHTLKEKIRENFPQFCEKQFISMHFRIGDYKNIQDSHPVLSNQYYINSLNNLIESLGTDKLDILIFYEEVDINQIHIKIKILKKRFPNMTFTKIDPAIEDWQQMLIMSCCQHNIIANSSFSWWGAYFNDNKEKHVLYPDVWFGKKLNNNTKDLCPATWTKISNQ